jgi:RNA polymerase sigma-70 factor, ECF subfamily
MIELYFESQTGINFNFFYKKYRPKLIWFLTKISKDEIIAEEIADESILKSLDEFDKYDKEKSHISTWLFTIAKRLMYQRLKDDSRFDSIDKEYDGTTIADTLIADTRDPHIYENILVYKSNLIKNIIPTLPRKYSTVLKLREIDGLTYQEIADGLKLNLSTVKSQIRQGRIIVKKQLETQFKKIDIYFS